MAAEGGSVQDMARNGLFLGRYDPMMGRVSTRIQEAPMPLPSMKDQFAALIAAPSVSCTQPSLDQSNRPVSDLLAGWLGDLGFACDIQQVSPGKFNLLATFGTGPGGLYWLATATPCRSTRPCGKPIP